MALYATFAPKFNPDGPEIAEKLMTTRAAHKMSAESATMGRGASMLLPGDKDPDGEGADEGGPATGGGASSTGGGAGDSVSDGVGGGTGGGAGGAGGGVNDTLNEQAIGRSVGIGAGGTPRPASNAAGIPGTIPPPPP